MTPLAWLTLAWTLAPIPPGDAIRPPADAGPADAVVLLPHPGPRPLTDCPATAWSHHPIDPATPGRWCAAWIRLDPLPPILAVGRPGHPPMALLPSVYRMTPTEGTVTLTATAPPTDPTFSAALTDALTAWAADPGAAR